MYQIRRADYCGYAYRFITPFDYCNCTYKEIHCCAKMSQCHITLYVAPIEDGNVFTFNYQIANPNDNATKCNSMCVIKNETDNIHIKTGSIEETIRYLELKDGTKLSIMDPGPRFVKEYVWDMLNSYKDSKLMRAEYLKRKSIPYVEKYYTDNEDTDDTDIDEENLIAQSTLEERFIEHGINEIYPSHDWILNDEYTVDEMLIEHPFFGNISEMIRLRQIAIEHFLISANYAVTETLYMFK